MTQLQIVETVIGNVDAELAVIAGLLCESKLVDSVADMLEPDDFADRFLGHVYGLIVREHSLGRSVNPITLKPFLQGEPAYEEMGGFAWLAQLTASNLAIGAVRGSAEQVSALAKRRRLVDGLRETIRAAEDFSQSPEDLVSSADAAISAATGETGGIHQPSGAECLDEVMATFNAPRDGVFCGTIPCLDDLLGPLRPKQLIIGAGRPGMGKTAAALSYALGAAKKGHGTLFVSLEMSSVELGARMAADLCFDGNRGIPFSAINEGRVTGPQGMEISRARNMLDGLPLRVIDVGSITIGRLGMMVRRHARRMAAAGQKLELVVVDYLQLVEPDQRMRSNYEAVSAVSRGLKAIAKTHGVAVFALAQLSREVEKRLDKRPQMSDLRDSGQIEQDADAVLFLVRDEYYVRLAEPENDSPEYPGWLSDLQKCAGKIEFILAKRRNGCVGRTTGHFHTMFQAVRG